MASLPPSAAITSTPKRELDFSKSSSNSLPGEKSSSTSFQKSHRFTHLDESLDTKSLDFREALSALKEGKEVDSYFYAPLLQECLDKGSVSDAQIVHGHIVKTGAHEDVFVTGFLVNVYAKCKNIESARKVFDNMPRRNVISWTTLMAGYMQNSQPENAIRVFQEMLDAGSYPSNYSLTIALNACTCLNSVKLGDQFHAFLIKYHINSYTSIGNALCCLYSKGGRLFDALRAFKRIEEPDVISWTGAISACGDNGEATMGIRIFVQMLSENVQPNEVTLVSVLGLCCEILSLELGTQVHSLSAKLGHDSNLRIRNSLTYLYLKHGWIDEAQRLFSRMESVSLVTWNSMIAGYSQMMELAKDDFSVYRSGSEALNLFLKLNRSDMKPDLFTFSSVLSICSRLVALEQGEQIHAQAIKTGFLSDVVVGTSLVNMYNKCGSIERAGKVFLEMSTRTMILWTSMINGYSQHGRSQQALDLFEDMKLARVRPNVVTFVGVLSACSHAGLVNEALRYFEIMQKEYKLKPVKDHYGCLIDMYVKLGRLEEAFDFIKEKGFEPSEFIWSNLIAGCRSHGNLQLAFYAAEQLLNLRPKDTETYVLLLNMYLSAGRFKDVSRVRKIMKEEKVGRLRDLSRIFIKDRVYSFKPNDKRHPQLYQSLEDLVVKATNLGYKPLEKSMEPIEEEEEEEEDGKASPVSRTSAAYHSEKLAITFGLENFPNSSLLRVTKSTMMCRDCHSFIKYVSKLTGREIVVRDSRGLHKFVDGQCSCGDFRGLV